MTTKLGRDLQVGDKVYSRESGEVWTIGSLDKGFMARVSRLAHFKENSEWTTVYHDDEYEIAEEGETK